jgi:hypothetical protein
MKIHFGIMFRCFVMFYVFAYKTRTDGERDGGCWLFFLFMIIILCISIMTIRDIRERKRWKTDVIAEQEVEIVWANNFHHHSMWNYS